MSSAPRPWIARISRRPRLTRRRLVVGALSLTLIAGLLAWAAWPRHPGYQVTSALVTVDTGPDQKSKIILDTSFYLPASASRQHRVPAVLLAHGFGGTKDSVDSDARDLAERGYAVLTWTAEGFGASGGQIHLDSPDWEVRDAQQLLDWLADRPEVLADGAGDPRVAVVGGSYGGALALLLAGYDQRVDAIVPQITWHDLADALLPEATGAGPDRGVFKKSWAGLFFTRGAGMGAAPARSGSGAALAGGQTAVPDPACGRFAADFCAAYLSMATDGHADPAAIALLRRSSPRSVLNRIKAPTLLVQGEADSLFPLAEADANAQGIAANGTPVRVAWFTGGHDGGAGPQSDQDRVRYLTVQWLDHYLKNSGGTPPTSFTYSRVAGLDAVNRGVTTVAASVSAYPGLSGSASPTISAAGPAQQVANPPGGSPAAISSLPGMGTAGLSSFVNGVVTDLPGQHARFVTEPLTTAVDIVGTPTVQIRAASPTGTAVLFVKLYDVDPSGSASLPNGLVAPVRLSGLPASIGDATPVTVTLPAIVHRFEAGHRLRVTVASADQAYAMPADPTVYTVALGAAPVTLPVVVGTAIVSPNMVWRWVLLALVVVLVFGLVLAIVLGRRRYRRADRRVTAEFAEIPLVVSALRKEYADGFVAVSSVDFTVLRNQVVGLLGPNGAGKTTTLRVLMGLTQPTLGDVYVFGRRLVPGAPILSRVGALVEGPGFLPHLTGRANLDLYWRATGRPVQDAQMDEALEIAGLGDAMHRRVKTYSHGMRQRLAIAQAMLGLPELLVLDEPTDGLDPPQIAEMRRVLKRYATDGRAVLVSSHLLAEVEQTCTHVVVMHRGRKVADGPVADIVGDSPTVHFDVSDGDAAELVLRNLTGVRSVVREGDHALIVDMDVTPRARAVAALVRAGVDVDRVAPRQRLEDAFLSLVGGDTKASGER